MNQLVIRPAKAEDFKNIEQLFCKVMQTGDTYIYSPDASAQEIQNLWMKDAPYVAIEQNSGNFVGTYVIRPNKIGRGAHVCNAGFMIEPDIRNRGFGREMGKHALEQALALGYLAMQFNVVVSTNERAVYLWKSLGFKIIGTIPEGFRHAEKGLVDIHIMHRFL
jgi:L-amino acid N-acyltransferase YncA